MANSNLTLLLAAEKEYQDSLAQAIDEATRLIAADRREHEQYLADLKQKWAQAETDARNDLQQRLQHAEEALTASTEKDKKQLLALQQLFLPEISERLVKEVMERSGSSQNGQAIS